MEIKHRAGPGQMIIGNQYVLFKEYAKMKTNFANKGSFLKGNVFKETIEAVRTNQCIFPIMYISKIILQVVK